MLMVEQLRSKFQRSHITQNFWRRILYSSFLILAINLLVFAPAFAVIDDTTRVIYAQNNIRYYDSTESTTFGSSACITGGNGTISGSAATEKIWSGLTTIVGLTDEQAAGVMGNMRHESNFNPAQHEISLKNKYQPGFALDANAEISYGLGLIQWSFGRRIDMYNYVKEKNPSLLEYLNNYQTYSYTYLSGDQFIALAGDAVANELIQYEMEVLRHELNTESSYKGIYDTTSVYDAAKFFLENVEKPLNPYITSHPERATDAQAYYDLYHGTTIASSSSNSSMMDATSVTIIGDSITNRSRSAIEAIFEGTNVSVNIDAADGRQFTAGIDVLDSIIANNNLGDTVIFALGTNNSALSMDSVNTVIEKVHAVDPSKIIVFVTNYSSNDPDVYFQNNTKLQSAASAHSGTVLIADWATVASTDPAAYIDATDGLYVHPTLGVGTELFAKTITSSIANGTSSTLSGQVVNGCNSGYSNTGSGGVTIADIDGYSYAFPLAGATKDNYLRNSNQELMAAYGQNDGWGVSVLSQPTNWYHHDYPAVDLGIWAEKVDGQARSASDSNHWGGDSSISDPRYYLSSGATVVAFTSGTVTSTRNTYTASGVPAAWQTRCGSISIQGNDGHKYFYTHISADSIKVSQGDTVEVGQPLAEVGAPYCAQSTQAHLHLDMDGDSSSGKRTSNSALTSLISKLYDALPENAAELAEREAASGSNLVSGGMTLAQAQAFMEVYAVEADKFQRGTVTFQGATITDSGCPDGTLNNCSAFTAWFVNRYTSLSNVPVKQGSQAVSTYLSMYSSLIDGGKVPKPYAIMSQGPFEGKANFDNHTGIVLGIDKANDQIIIGEASCGMSHRARWYRPRAKAYSLSEYTNNPAFDAPHYAYTDNVLIGL